MMAFRAETYLWQQIAEYSFDTFMMIKQREAPSPCRRALSKQLEHDAEKLHDFSGNIMRQNKHLERNRDPDSMVRDRFFGRRRASPRHSSFRRTLPSRSSCSGLSRASSAPVKPLLLQTFLDSRHGGRE